MFRINGLTVALLCCSNLVMLTAWYGHLGHTDGWPVWRVILVSWLIALGEYCLMVPANRLGARTMSLEQLKIVQEAVSLVVFVPFSIFVMRQGVTWHYAAASVLILGAVLLIFRAP